VAQPRTQFARVGDVNVGFQVFGEGPIDLVWIWGLASNIETIWEEPSYAAFLRRLGEFARVIVFDRRGSGVSDREGTASTPTLEERVEDVLTVLDAAGSTRAAAFGISEGGALAAVLAATHPERVERIVIYGTMARFLRDADHPWGWMDGAHLATFLEETRATWGTTEGGRDAVRRWAPSMVDDEQFTDWVSRQRRQSVSRGAIGPLLWGSVTAYDLVDVFPAVHVPTLVLHRTGDALIPIAQARWIAEQIPGARFVELPGNDHYPFVGDADGVLAEIEMFVGGGRDPRPRDRRLLTIAVTEVVSSARNLEHLRDDSWRELLAAHDRMTRTHLARFGGEELKRTGEGFVATFDGPARAIRCVLGVLDAAERLGLALPRRRAHR
jgi:pimeloyl-ACP methyl ester carboxylesterase